MPLAYKCRVYSDISYVKGINNIKFGAMYSQTFLRENDTLAVVSSDLQFTLRGCQR